jgi:hypothetical protein
MIPFDIDDRDDFFIGEDKVLPITIYQANKKSLQNITAWTLSWMLKSSLDDADNLALLTKTTTSGITMTAPTSGVCTVTIADTDTDALQPGKYWHELKRTDAGSEVVLCQGRCVLKRGVHRS